MGPGAAGHGARTGRTGEPTERPDLRTTLLYACVHALLVPVFLPGLFSLLFDVDTMAPWAFEIHVWTSGEVEQSSRRGVRRLKGINLASVEGG